MTTTSTTHWDPVRYARHAGFVPELGSIVLNMLGPRAGERVLDLGCGDGVLTAQLAAAGCEVIGIDTSAEQVAAARARGLDARVGNAENLAAFHDLDAVFSNAALHWVRDHDALLAGVYKALRPGGRFVAECGGHGAVAAIRVALSAVLARRDVDAAALNPWYFPTADAYRARLERAGFQVARIEQVPRPVVLPTDLAGWLDTFAGVFLNALPESERAAAVSEVVQLTEPVLRDERGRWTADYVRLRFIALRPAGEQVIARDDR